MDGASHFAHRFIEWDTQAPSTGGSLAMLFVRMGGVGLSLSHLAVFTKQERIRQRQTYPSDAKDPMAVAPSRLLLWQQ